MIGLASPDLPTPPGLPFLGNVLEYRRDPLRLLRRAARDHGPLVRLRLGPLHLHLVSAPADVARILMESPQHFGKSALIRVLGRPLLGDALDALDGSAWSERRRLVAPAFRPARLGAMAETVVDPMRRLLGEWEAGERRRFDQDALRVMIEASVEAICGARIAADAAREAGGAIREALAAFDARINLGLRTPEWLPLPHLRRLRSAMRRLHEATRAAVDGRRPTAQSDGDVLSFLRTNGASAAYTDQTLRDELTVMAMLGGHQLSLALTWAVYLVATHAEVAQRVREEAAPLLAGRTLAASDPLPHATAVIDETLRLYPPFPLFVREALRAVDIAGHRLPAGATIVLSPWVTQRLPSVFEAPDDFRPERWVDGMSRRLPHGAYFPFGGGARVCIANQLARTQLALALAMICGTHRLEVQAGHAATPLPKIGLAMRGGLPVTVRPVAAATETAPPFSVRAEARSAP